jgi:hypothetical protein
MSVRWDDDPYTVDSVNFIAPLQVVNPPRKERNAFNLAKANVILERALACWHRYNSGCCIGNDYYDPIVKQLGQQLENNKRRIDHYQQGRHLSKISKRIGDSH